MRVIVQLTIIRKKPKNKRKNEIFQLILVFFLFCYYRLLICFIGVWPRMAPLNL